MMLVWIVCSFMSFGEILYPVDDIYFEEKQALIQELEELMPDAGSAGYVVRSSRIFLWANEIPKSLITGGNEDLMVNVPLFIPRTPSNELSLKLFVESQCECDMTDQDIGGVLVANPTVAARMYFREHWMGHGPEDLDSVVPPIVIAYHEFSHASDYLKNEDFFFDMSGMPDKQWGNKAEESAVTQQNDLVMTIIAKKQMAFGLRRSYGRNQLFPVSDFYSITPLVAMDEEMWAYSGQ